MSMLIEYVRGKNNQRVGVVVALDSKHIGRPNIGWSRCNRRDKFDKKKALEIAIGRAKLRPLVEDNTYEQNNEIYDLPPSMFEAVEKMRERMKKYFHRQTAYSPLENPHWAGCTCITCTNKRREN